MTSNSAKLNQPSSYSQLNVYFILRTTPTFIKSRGRNTIIITPTIIKSPRSSNFFRDRSSESEELVKPRSLTGLVLELAYCWNCTACRVWSLQRLSFAEARLAVEAPTPTPTPSNPTQIPSIPIHITLTHIHTKTKTTS